LTWTRPAAIWLCSAGGGSNSRPATGESGALVGNHNKLQVRDTAPGLKAKTTVTARQVALSRLKARTGIKARA
jgi:hypothetical protein